MAFRSFLVLGLLLAVQLQCALGAKSGKRAAYFMDNDVAGNNIVSLTIDPETGFLSSPVLTPTGGKGALGALPTGEAAGPDTLFTQDSVVVEGNVSILHPHRPLASQLEVVVLDVWSCLHFNQCELTIAFVRFVVCGLSCEVSLRRQSGFQHSLDVVRPRR